MLSRTDSSLATGPAAEVSVYTSPRDWPDDVRDLFQHAERDNVQFGESWYRNLIETVFSSEGSARFHVMRRNGRAVAALALRVSPAHPHRVESLANFYTCLYAPALLENVGAEDLVPLIRAIMRSHSLASLRLAPMDPLSAGYRNLFEAIRMAGMRPFGFFSFGNWFLPVVEDWPSYLKAREGSVRSTLKRMGKKFAAESGSLEIITGGERLAAGLSAYQQVYAASWKNAEPFPDFMPGLIRACADKGWLRLGVAWLQGRAVAAQVWVVANGRAEIYKLAYDEAFKAYSPGTLLTALLMQHAFEEDKVGEIDYLIGDDPYKKAWMSGRRERWGIVAYDPRSPAGLIGLCRETLGRAAKPWRAKLLGWARRARGT